MATTRAAVHVDTATTTPVSPFVFGALTEHFGRGLYGGLWSTEHDAPRADVQNAVRAMGTTMFRYPGGCFADWYHWRDGVGPKQSRPTHDRQFWTDFRMGDGFPAEMAREFGPVETNTVGTDEFLQYCVDTEVEPMLVANFGSGTPEEAADWVRHCNRGAAPRPVRWWSVGNETYGDWEIGHCSAGEYADRYVDFSRAMRAVDPSIRIVAVGCGGLGPEGGDTGWNRTVLSRAGEDVDALSVHFYFPGPVLGRALRDDQADYLQVATGADELGAMLDAVIADADSAGLPRAVPISLDEWNLWADWRDLLTTNHRLADAVFFAGCYNRILERADRVTMAMISHQVNCMAPIQTRCERSFGTSAFLVGMMYRRAARASVAGVRVECDTLVAPAFDGVDSDSVAMTAARTALSLDATATHDAGGTAVFLANRRPDGAITVTITGLPPNASGRLRHLTSEDHDPFARNDEDTPDALRFRDVAVTVGGDGRATVELPPHTAGVVEVRP
jgi:alpha-N-arabinofuranosidase